jgi:hypothetical protein
MNNMQVTEPIATRATEPDWSGWENWLRSHLDIEREVMTEAFGEALGITCQELRDRISALELKLAELTGAIDILRGLQPPPPAKFQTIRAWKPDTIHYEGAIVAFAGGTWQAQCDTARVPGAQDWVCLASAGHSFTVRATFDESVSYRRLDVVALNGGSFIALKDAPGPCPGSGWQLIASQGKRGAAGEKGERGAQGPQGNPGLSGATIRDWKIDREKYVATPLMSDGRDGPPLELLGLFQQFFAEVQK